jgi:GTP cyclohydrolase II
MLRSPLVSTDNACATACKPDGAARQAFAPRVLEQLLRMKGDLRMGLPVILEDGPQRTLVALVEHLTEDRYAAMTKLGVLELVLTRRRAGSLGAALPPHADILRLKVSFGTPLQRLAALAGEDFSGNLTDVVDRMVLEAGTPTQRAAIMMAKSAEVVPAILSVPLADDADVVNLMSMPVHTVSSALDEARAHEPVSSARLPMEASQAGRVHVFRPDDGGAEHYAIEIGAPDLTSTTTVRLHSACFTGDVLGSLKCDCGPQLRASIAAMAAGSGGVLIYLNQEGRGIGLANKMRSYALQDAGLDTVEANHWLGFEDDQRDFRTGAMILRRMGIDRIRLMTNNPAKVSILSSQGIEVVERLPIQVGHTPENARYLATKAEKSGHLL